MYVRYVCVRVCVCTHVVPLNPRDICLSVCLPDHVFPSLSAPKPYVAWQGTDTLTNTPFPLTGLEGEMEGGEEGYLEGCDWF